MTSEGKKTYDREFLLQLEHQSDSVIKPDDLADVTKIIEQLPDNTAPCNAEVVIQEEDKLSSFNSEVDLGNEKDILNDKLPKEKGKQDKNKPASGKGNRTGKPDFDFSNAPDLVTSAADENTRLSDPSKEKEPVCKKKKGKESTLKNKEMAGRVDVDVNSASENLYNASEEKVTGKTKQERRVKEQRNECPEDKRTGQKRGRPYSGKGRQRENRPVSESEVTGQRRDRPHSGKDRRETLIESEDTRQMGQRNKQSQSGNDRPTNRPVSASKRGSDDVRQRSDNSGGQNNSRMDKLNFNHRDRQQANRQGQQANRQGQQSDRQGQQPNRQGQQSDRQGQQPNRQGQQSDRQGQQSYRQGSQSYNNQQVKDMKSQDGENRRNPKGQGRGKNQTRKGPAEPKQVFEPYWSLEDLNRGLKTGQLIQGPMRINPKNYEECYIPHPDGVSDIFISGLKNRNRAMNGDIVAVLIHDRDQWRVDMDNLGCYEDSVTKVTPTKTGTDDYEESSASMEQLVNAGAMQNSGPNKVENVKEEDSDPDVVVESEEEIDLVTGESVKLTNQKVDSSTRNSTSTNQETCNKVDLGITLGDELEESKETGSKSMQTSLCNNITEGVRKISIAECDIDLSQIPKQLYQVSSDLSQVSSDFSGGDLTRVKSDFSQVGCHLGQTHSDSSQVSYDFLRVQSDSSLAQHSSLSQSNLDPSKNKNSYSQQRKKKGQNTPNNQNKQNDKGNNSAKRTPQRKYTSLQDIMQEGSPVAKNLFDQERKDQKERKGHSDKYLQRTAKVVAIIEPKHSRACTGNIKLMQDKNPNKALFVPMDARVPRIIIPMSNCPPNFMERPEDHANTLFIARIIDWPDTSMMAHGELKRSLGEAGEIEPETEGILIENDVDFAEFSEQALDCLPVKVLPWTIPDVEYTYRRDFREQCIFTIDPTTARDLDDALSCEKLEDGTYEIGVHIADVSHFLKEGTVLDGIAGSRATSVYLVQKVIPMLPRILCEQLCSLNPNDDRLTFSVVWKMSDSGEIYEEWFGRSVINSCVKLSYDHAQGFIEQPNRTWTTEELPPIARFSVCDIKERVLNLNKIAVCLRQKRFDGGALRLDQVKLQYTLDPSTGLPNGYNVYQQRDSNRLVEEFMLLANMAVAHKIKSAFPSTALLRRHPPPQSKMADELSALCQSLGVPIDISSAGSLQQSLWSYCGEDEYSTARMQVLVSMCSRPMQNAKYFCTGSIPDEELFHHYALNVPLYTHFTSPIRRYADVIVHRHLAAALGYCKEQSKGMADIQKQAEQCNDKKTNSKRVQDLSSELYFAVFVKAAGPFEEKAMVMSVLDKSFDVFVLKLGVVKRVYCDKLEIKDKTYIREQKKPVLTLIWAVTDKHKTEVHQTISIFTVVDCVLQAGDRPLAWMVISKSLMMILDDMTSIIDNSTLPATIKHPDHKDVCE